MPGEEIQGPPLAPPGDDGRPLAAEESREAELARADAAASDDSDAEEMVVVRDGSGEVATVIHAADAARLGGFVCPVCGLSACSHNLPYVESP